MGFVNKVVQQFNIGLDGVYVNTKLDHEVGDHDNMAYVEFQTLDVLPDAKHPYVYFTLYAKNSVQRTNEQQTTIKTENITDDNQQND
ncbi:unnamed protein product [Didymodactylos carnosus]|uniref:Uncharacterized protein n=1 Tax=Didymodactylos carnosus TaxID=1234261 RepID=A0A815HYL5_9BILA|nr:unnamed protein product [Didymodactylos carnosus]CAF4235562.1 unnamed protein product [Didymodactylos carnosus]